MLCLGLFFFPPGRWGLKLSRWWECAWSVSVWKHLPWSSIIPSCDVRYICWTRWSDVCFSSLNDSDSVTPDTVCRQSKAIGWSLSWPSWLMQKWMVENNLPQIHSSSQWLQIKQYFQMMLGRCQGVEKVEKEGIRFFFFFFLQLISEENVLHWKQRKKAPRKMMCLGCPPSNTNTGPVKLLCLALVLWID